jgi:hypothetical protein
LRHLHANGDGQRGVIESVTWTGARNELVAAEFAGRKAISIAPNPGLTRLNGSDKGMFRAMKVFGRMLVLGRIATAYVTALEA